MIAGLGDGGSAAVLGGWILAFAFALLTTRGVFALASRKKQRGRR